MAQEVNGAGVASMAQIYSDAGDAAYDFRSDTVTKPTRTMIQSISKASLQDDVFQEDSTTNALQDFVAELSGKESALLVTSGTLGNQLSIRTHLTQPPHSVLADASSHIIGWEAGSLASLSGALAIPVRPRNDHHLTLEDVKANAVVSDDIHACPTRLICVENTLAGTIMPLKDCQAISEWARSQDPPIRMHLDGARLWEAVAAGAGTLRDYCECFDSASLCFSKGLGAPIGSIIVGSKSFTKRARHIRKSLGAGMRQTGIIAAPARVSLEETFLSGRLKATHAHARDIASMWEHKGGKLLRNCETNMVWLDLEAASISKAQLIEMGLKHGVALLGGRLVVHYQIRPEATERLARVMDAILNSTSANDVSNGELKQKAEKVMAPQLE